jgi:hypothetical protein
MRVRYLTRPRSLLLALCLAAVSLVGDASAAPRGQAVRIIRPRAGSRIYLPRSRAAIREQRKAERFFKYRYGAKAYLKASGAKPAPASYHAFVNRALARAEQTLNMGGLSIRDMEVLVLEEGAADGLNAASWAGRVLTFNRDLIDRSFDIASAVQAANDEVEVEKNLFKLAMWEQRGGAKPQFKVKNRARRDLTAEGIFMGVVLHEVGHSFLHSPAAVENEPPLWVPGKIERESAAESRRDESEADAAGTELALAGASPDPAAYTLFFKYMKVLRGVSPRLSGVRIGDNQTHPSDDDRIRATNRILRENGIANPYEPDDPGKIWTPSRELIVPGRR